MSLAAEGLAVRLGGRAVLDGIDVAFEGGAFVAVVGPNGAGKSTLVRALAGLLRPDAGRVVLDRRDLAGVRPGTRARAIAYLPQGAILGWPLAVERLVGLGRLPHLGALSRLAPADAAAIARAMARADVGHLRDRIATELSGGERARALLARALAVEAGVLIADEPLAALDPGHALEVMALLRTEARAGVAVVAVMHELTLAARFADRLVLLDRGRVVADGPSTAVLSPANLRAVYGVEAWVGDAGSERLIVPLRRTPEGATGDHADPRP